MRRKPHKRCYQCEIVHKMMWQLAWCPACSALWQWCHQDKLKRGCAVMRLTGVSHELKGSAKFTVASGSPSTHMKHIRGEGGEALDVRASGWCFYDAIASFILVLRMTKRQSVTPKLLFWNFDVWKLSHSITYLLVILDLILQDDTIGPLWWLPGQWDGVSGDILCLDGSYWRRGWLKKEKKEV